MTRTKNDQSMLGGTGWKNKASGKAPF